MSPMTQAQMAIAWEETVMADNKKPKSDTDTDNASSTPDVDNASGSADVGNASGTADVPPDDDPLSDANLDRMNNTGTTWGRYRNRR